MSQVAVVYGKRYNLRIAFLQATLKWCTSFYSKFNNWHPQASIHKVVNSFDLMKHGNNLKSENTSLLIMLNFIISFSITWSVVLLLDNVIPSKSHSFTKFIGEPLKYSGATFTIAWRLKIIYFVLKRWTKCHVFSKNSHTVPT